VPYVPTIGPVHPATFDVNLFEDVLKVAGTGSFLPYDKNKRWSDWKDETVLLDEIEHGPGRTLIPTLARQWNSLTLYAYGVVTDAKVVELATKLATANHAACARVLTFHGPEWNPSNGVASVRVQLGHFAGPPALLDFHAVKPTAGFPEAVQATFATFADRLATDGFDFLYRRMQAGDVGPVLAVTDGSRVVGAIGPMETMADSLGAARLLPPYFAVLSDHRRQGHGRALWRAATAWASHHGAEYVLLQTQSNGPSDGLLQAEGLHSLGFVCTATI